MALDFFAGCLGGAAGIVIGHPLDTIKVLVQSQTANGQNAINVFKNIIKHDGIRGMYRGVTAPVAGSVMTNTIIFGIFGNTQRYFEKQNVLYPCVFAGAIAGLVQSPLINSIELVKIRYQISPSNNRQGQNMFKFIKEIYAKEGLRKGLLKGNLITVLREVPSYTVYFLTYELLTSKKEDTSTARMLIAGGLAGQASWLFTYPLDVIKTRLQSDQKGEYNGIIDCTKKIIKSDGYSIFFKGISISLIRAFPSNAVCFAVVTWTFRLWDWKFNSINSIPLSGNEINEFKKTGDSFRLCDVNPQSGLQLA